MPMPLQTLGWAVRTMPFLERAQAKYGDMWTMKLAQEGPWVMVSDPDVVKQVFKGDPRCSAPARATPSSARWWATTRC